MPIYEYRAEKPKQSCVRCRTGFEVLQWPHESALTRCPECGRRVRKIISLCHSAVMETAEEHARTMENIKSYERAGMWSHAAELADKHSEKIGDRGLKTRALDNYKKAGYDAHTLDKHSKNNK